MERNEVCPLEYFLEKGMWWVFISYVNHASTFYFHSLRYRGAPWCASRAVLFITLTAVLCDK